ncbi:RNA polymerase II-associated protein 1 [Phytophthora cinnamomi]|uniref:RNA polymerase II-associated protein 1 n=1 Tax=Phytophthora cinnamomi TaxID=4785 RepID=UPI0035598D6A|nr:RNA polymerase II-associated protein 1 [Phytophthora cinnamomi]
MPSPPHSPVARARILGSYRARGDCMLVEARNGISPISVRRTKVCEIQWTRGFSAPWRLTGCAMKDMVAYDFSTSTISDKLIGILYTVNQGKNVVVVLDNAPAHSQTEDRVVDHDDLELLSLAPYSPMCHPIEGSFSVLKVRINAGLALSRDELVASHPRGQIAECRVKILERAAKRNISYMDLRLVSKMALHCQYAVVAAERMEDMQYGTSSTLRFTLGFHRIAL